MMDKSAAVTDGARFCDSWEAIEERGSLSARPSAGFAKRAGWHGGIELPVPNGGSIVGHVGEVAMAVMMYP
jgi:hypothetical protein